MSGGGQAPAGNTNTIQKSDPWGGQAGFLNNLTQTAYNQLPNGQTAPGVFQSAANLYANYTPQYFPQSTVSPLTGQQLQAIGQEGNLAGMPGGQATGAASNFLISSDQGNFLNANPGNQTFGNIASNNSGLMNPGNQAFGNIAGTNTGLANPENSILSPYNSGAFLSAGNPYFQSIAQQTLGDVVPGLESQFTQGNSMNNPAMAYATTRGAEDALGGLAFNQFNTQQQNQLAAAQALGTNFNTGIGNQLMGAQGLSGNYNTGIQNMLAGAQGLSSNFQGGLNQATQAAMLAPGAQQADVQQIAALSDAGQTLQAQQQAQLNDAINRWNFSQQLPYNQLDQYAGIVQGATPGGTSTLTQPYFLSPGGGALGTALGVGGGALSGAALGSEIYPGWGTAIGAIGGGLLGAFGSG